MNHHKNESCFAKVTCKRCKCEYVRNETHGVEECIVSLAQKVERLEREKIDRDSLMTLLLRKVDRKSNDQLLHLMVNDFDAARNQLNK